MRWVLLSIISVVSAATWWAAIIRLAWLPTYYQVPHLDTPKLMGISEASLNSFELAAAAELLLYLLAWRLARPLRGRRTAAAVLLLTAPAAVSLILTYPVGAGDIYAYIAEADLVLRSHLNPFFVPVGQVPGSPLLPFLDFPNETTHYGPLWLLVGVTLRLLSGGDLLIAMILLKAAAVLMLGLMGWMAFLILGDDHPAEAVGAAVLIAWNPLMLFEFGANGHNDAAMMALVVLGFYMQSRGRRRAAMASLIAACLVKYVAVVLVPIFLVVDLRAAGPGRRWLPAVALDTLGLTLFAAALTLVVGIDGTLGVLQRMTTWFTTSPGAVLYYHLTRTIAPSAASDFVSEATRVVYVVLYVAILLWIWLRPSAIKGAALAAMVAFMFVETVWFQPWYIAWAFPIAVLIANPVGNGIAIGMTAGGFGIHSMMGFAWRLWWVTEDRAVIHARGAAAMWLPTLATGVFGLAVRLVSRRTQPIGYGHTGPRVTPSLDQGTLTNGFRADMMDQDLSYRYDSRDPAGDTEG